MRSLHDLGRGRIANQQRERERLTSNGKKQDEGVTSGGLIALALICATVVLCVWIVWG